MRQADLIEGTLYKLNGYAHGGVVQFTGECEHVRRPYSSGKGVLNARVRHYNGRTTLVTLNQLQREASPKDVSWWTAAVEQFKRLTAEQERINALSPAAFDAELIAAEANVKLTSDALEDARDAHRAAVDNHRNLSDRRRREDRAAHVKRGGL